MSAPGESAPAFAPDFAAATVRPSCNFGARRGGRTIDALIMHYTGMESGAAAEAWLCDPRSAVSCHYLVHEDGAVVQMVPEAKRAWHAGRGSWRGESDVNSFSLGIEIVNRGHGLGYPDFPEAQIAAVIALAGDICWRRAIAPERVLAHSDVAPGRKIDPGEKFPWGRLAAAGVGHFVAPHPVADGAALRPGDTGAAVAALQAQLAGYGYALEESGVYDARTRLIVQEFQRHFRPERVDGLADLSTRRTLALLCERLPGDSVRAAGSGESSV